MNLIEERNSELRILNSTGFQDTNVTHSSVTVNFIIACKWHEVKYIQAHETIHFHYKNKIYLNIYAYM